MRQLFLSLSRHIQIKLAMPAIEMKKYTSLVMKLIESAVATLEKGTYIFLYHTFYSVQYLVKFSNFYLSGVHM